ncbi:sulfotransferase [soil metagenome]
MSESPMPIVVGSPRSGTTLLRMMLDAHPDLAIPPETGFLLSGPDLVSREEFLEAITHYPPEAPGWADFQIPEASFRDSVLRLEPFTVADGFRLFYRLYAHRFNKSRYGDKTPGYTAHLARIESVLPEARFVHIIRDGRDAAVSLRRCWFSPGHDIETQARFWRTQVFAAREQGCTCRHYLEVRYEDLLHNMEAELRRVCTFIELEFHPAMLRYHERAPDRLQEHLARRRTDGTLVVSQADRHRQQIATTQVPDHSRIQSWKQALSPAEAFRFEAIAGDMLDTYGYERSDAGPHGGPHVRDHLLRGRLDQPLRHELQ